MRNLVVCCDGTWNTPDQEKGGVPVPTNVVRLFNALLDRDDAGNEQLKYYHPGVGTDGTWWQKLAGGSLGVGLDQHVMSAYRWLGAQYQAGDRLFLVGFSRGAFTARSLGGMIARCGLLNLVGLPDSDTWARVETAYVQGYRQRAERWAGTWSFHHGDAPDGHVDVYFVGVWDTVGALGIPDDMAILNLLDDPRRYAFHDTILSDKVRHARHAVALDERRASFTPTLWTGVESHPDVKQVWFPGVHCDVGGSYPEKGLSDGALVWMLEEAATLGLAVRADMKKQLTPDPQGVLHDSQTGPFKLLRTQPRSVPLIAAQNAPGLLHASALARQAAPPIAQAPYRPSITLKPGEERELPIYAVQHWNWTGIYLEAGARYLFAARGEWLDRDIKCGPAGPKAGTFQIGELVQAAGSLLGKVEVLYKKLTKNEEADLRGTRREENMPWFALVGVIANGGNPTNDSTPAPYETFLIGDGCEYPAATAASIRTPGYLYCFANDAWHFYDNNRGSVTLTVKRLA
jgi:uncharacterized protein (DUF2235 family)